MIKVVQVPIEGTQKSVSEYTLAFYSARNKKFSQILTHAGGAVVFSIAAGKLAQFVLTRATAKLGSALLGGFITFGGTILIAVAANAAITLADVISDAIDEANFMCLDDDTLGAMSSYVPEDTAKRVMDVMNDIGTRHNIDILKTNNISTFNQYCRRIAEADSKIADALSYLSGRTIPTKGIFHVRVDFDEVKHSPLPLETVMLNSSQVKEPNARDFSNLAAFVMYLCGNMGYLDTVGCFDEYGFHDPELSKVDICLLGEGCTGISHIMRSFVNPVSVINVMPTLLALYLAGMGVVPGMLDYDGNLGIVDLNSLRTVKTNRESIGKVASVIYDEKLKALETTMIPLAQVNYKTLAHEIGDGSERDMISLCNYKAHVDEYPSAYASLRRKYGS